MEDFSFYFDDSGAPKPVPDNHDPYFALGGVFFNNSDKQLIENEILSFKKAWDISPETPLHGNKIRAKKRDFSWLRKLSDEELEYFHSELIKLIVTCPVVVHGCVISRSGYCNRYLDMYGSRTWEMRKTAFMILLERVAKLAAYHDARVMVCYEKVGKVEDQLLNTYFRDFRTNGHPFDQTNSARYQPLPVSDLRLRLWGLEGKTKKSTIMQLADLCLYPIVHAKSKPNDPTLNIMRDAKLLVDSILEPNVLDSMGIKYFCFE